MEKEFEHNGNILHYLHMGHGKRKLICLHGYGQNAYAFDSLTPQLTEHFEIIIPNLPFHHWDQPVDIPPKKQWRYVLNQLILKEWGKNIKVNLMAFSIGGRYALSYLSNYHQYVHAVCFIGIDGLRSVEGYRWLNLSPIGRFMFKLFIRFPAPVNLALQLGMRTRKISNGAYNYLTDSIATKEKRVLLRNRWKNAAQQGYHLEVLCEKLKKQEIPIYFIFGIKDPFIDPESAQQFCKALPKGKWMPLNTGHNLLNPRIATQINQFIEETSMAQDLSNKPSVSK